MKREREQGLQNSRKPLKQEKKVINVVKYHHRVRIDIEKGNGRGDKAEVKQNMNKKSGKQVKAR